MVRNAWLVFFSSRSARRNVVSAEKQLELIFNTERLAGREEENVE